MSSSLRSFDVAGASSWSCRALRPLSATGRKVRIEMFDRTKASRNGLFRSVTIGFAIDDLAPAPGRIRVLVPSTKSRPAPSCVRGFRATPEPLEVNSRNWSPRVLLRAAIADASWLARPAGPARTWDRAVRPGPRQSGAGSHRIDRADL